jgi:hypothetical protein
VSITDRPVHRLFCVFFYGIEAACFFLDRIRLIDEAIDVVDLVGIHREEAIDRRHDLEKIFVAVIEMDPAEALELLQRVAHPFVDRAFVNVGRFFLAALSEKIVDVILVFIVALDELDEVRNVNVVDEILVDPVDLQQQDPEQGVFRRDLLRPCLYDAAAFFIELEEKIARVVGAFCSEIYFEKIAVVQADLVFVFLDEIEQLYLVGIVLDMLAALERKVKVGEQVHSFVAF